MRFEPGFSRWVLVLALLAGLAACAGGPGRSMADAGADPLGTQDESEARRRARLRMELAVGYFEEGKTAVALDELKQVLTLDPELSDAHNLRGLIYMRLNEPRLAEESFRRAVALNPRDANTQHNYGWLLCQQGRYPQATQAFAQALANPQYGERAKTWMTQGLCQARAGQQAEAERSLERAYELDAGHPVTGYNLAALLYRRGEFPRAQFYIRRINNSELANAETLWLGVRVERKLNNREAMRQLADQLKRRFPQSQEFAAFERGAFDE